MSNQKFCFQGKEAKRHFSPQPSGSLHRFLIPPDSPCQMMKYGYSVRHVCCHPDWSVRTNISCCCSGCMWPSAVSRYYLSPQTFCPFLSLPPPSVYLSSWRHQSGAQPQHRNKSIRFSAKKSFKKENSEGIKKDNIVRRQ